MMTLAARSPKDIVQLLEFLTRWFLVSTLETRLPNERDSSAAPDKEASGIDNAQTSSMQPP